MFVMRMLEHGFDATRSTNATYIQRMIFVYNNKSAQNTFGAVYNKMRVIGNNIQTKKVRGVCDPIPTNLFSSLFGIYVVVQNVYPVSVRVH